MPFFTTAAGNSRQRIFFLLVLYRWASLAPPLFLILISLRDGAVTYPDGLSLLTAVFLNIVVTIFYRPLNQVLLDRPGTLAIDLVLMAALMGLSGGWRSPYYLYALNPLLAAAFFFSLRGAIIATTVFLPFYAIAVAADLGGTNPNILVIITAVIGFYLISGTFGYATALLSQLQSAQADTAKAQRDVAVIHDLAVSLHSAGDVEAVQQIVLEAIIGRLGQHRAVIGLVSEEAVLTGWQGQVHQGEAGIKELTHPARVPLTADGGLVAEAVLETRVCQATDADCTTDSFLNTHFGMHGCTILPIQWGVQPIGVLLVNGPGLGEDDTLMQTLEAIARQTAVTIGMMNTRLRRAKDLAIQEERARIGMEIHDTVSQSLFGIVYSLDGAIKLLDTDPGSLKPELEWALQTAEEARQKLRHVIQDIWTEPVTAAAFESDIRQYADDVLQAASLHVEFDVNGDFNQLSPDVWRSLYRISQESLTNVVHHAAATEARVCLDVADERARLIVRDNGRGFETAVALAQEYGQEHFGLRGIQDRVRSLGGTCDIFSQQGAGTSIVIDLPANARAAP